MLTEFPTEASNLHGQWQQFYVAHEPSLTDIPKMTCHLAS